MRRKPLILVAFLLMLYIMPLVFISSYASPTIPAEQNTTKDFVISASWYLEDFHYRKRITINGGEVATETDFQVLVDVTFDAHMQADFDDIRFLEDDHLTVLDHWLESKVDSTSARFWVQMNDVIPKGVEFDGSVIYIYMYYGNAGASSASHGLNTFLFYEDWINETVEGARWSTLSSDGSISWDDTDANHGSIAKVEGAAGNNAQSYESAIDVTAPYTLMFRANLESTVAAFQRMHIGAGSTSIFSFALLESSAGTEQFYVYDDDANQDSQGMDDTYFDAYFTYQIIRDGTSAKLYVDNVLRETASCSPDVISTPIASFRCIDSEYDLYSDWIAGRKFIVDEPSVAAWGEEENNITPEWNLISSIEIIFVVGIYTGNLDLLLIFGGLIMIPCSTLYLVKGGKDEMSFDKLFFGLIAFAIGWALFLGGIG